jgi:hypothetical protein
VAELQGKASAALDRAWRAADMLVMLEQTDSCPPGLHQHDDLPVIHRRID